MVCDGGKGEGSPRALGACDAGSALSRFSPRMLEAIEDDCLAEVTDAEAATVVATELPLEPLTW